MPPVKRRIIDQDQIGVVEMSEGYSTREQQVPELSQPDLYSDIWSEPFLRSDHELAPIVRESSALDESKQAIQKARSEFSYKETALSIAGTVPEALKELGHQIPGVGVIVSSVFLADDLKTWRELAIQLAATQHLITNHYPAYVLKTLPFAEGAAILSAMPNTLHYVRDQLERREEKLINSMIGKVLQVLGSGLTFTALFTHGVTLIPGLAIGIGGSVVKARVAVRSSYNYLKRKWNDELSVNREAHARYIFGAALIELTRLGHHNGNYHHLLVAHDAVNAVQNMQGSYQRDFPVALELAKSIPGLEYLRNDPPSQKDVSHFLRMGLWEIMQGIKS